MNGSRRISVNDRGYWETTDASGHVFDRQLCDTLLDYFRRKRIRSLFDFGCGMADYHRVFEANGIHSLAYDGNPHTPQLTGGRAKVLDLSRPFDLECKLKCVLSLEVGEHIPKEYESIFIDNLVLHSVKFIILSWAIPGQIGDGHVNCQPNAYIINQLDQRGYSFQEKDSDFLKSGSSAAWFINTIMVFKKRFTLSSVYPGSFWKKVSSNNFKW